MAIPELTTALGGWRVNDNLMAVPRLDGRQIGPAVLELALFDLAGAAVALGVGLIAFAKLLHAPLAGCVARQPAHPFVAGGENVQALAACRGHRHEVVNHM